MTYVTFFALQTAERWNGWYPRLGDEGNQHPVNASRLLKNAVVTCGPRPVDPPDCTKRSGPCLFDIEQDPCEYVNQADKQPEILAMMFKMLADYKSGMVAPKNKPYDYSANPKYHGGVWGAWREGDEGGIGY